MTLPRLRQITFLFPGSSAQERTFFRSLCALVGQVPNAQSSTTLIKLVPSAPADALPVTALEVATSTFPAVALDTEQQIDLRIGQFRLHSGTRESPTDTDAGDQRLWDQTCLSLGEVAARVRGHVTRIDHTGVNLPTGTVTRPAWNDLITALASSAALYRYPTGEAWPFVVPTSEAEFERDITDFVAGREPKFELVYDQWSPVPVLQWSIETDLVRSELEQLFPDPYGEAFPDLGDIFRTVYVAHPWPGLRIRFDLNYRSNGTPSVWDTSEWLVTEGGRINPLPG